MATHGYRETLKHQGLQPFLWTQFLGAFNDNMFKIVVSMLAVHMVAAGRADLVALARPHLVDPSFATRAAADYGVTDIACPVQYEVGRDALMRSAARDRADLLDLRRRGRPRSHSRDRAGGDGPDQAK